MTQIFIDPSFILLIYHLPQVSMLWQNLSMWCLSWLKWRSSNGESQQNDMRLLLKGTSMYYYCSCSYSSAFLVAILQVYSSSKSCVACGSDLTGSRSSSYWEGGQGCRNKVKMNRYSLSVQLMQLIGQCIENYSSIHNWCCSVVRNDRHKYSDSEGKTSSKKPERVGVKGKSSIHQNT